MECGSGLQPRIQMPRRLAASAKTSQIKTHIYLLDQITPANSEKNHLFKPINQLTSHPRQPINPINYYLNFLKPN
jgi:hypothetical protein